MSRTYSEEEKMEYVERYKSSGENIERFALENGIPGTTFRDWLKNDEELKFGEINIMPKLPNKTKANVTIFSSEKIRIELKEGFDKEFLKQIMEVMINVK